MWRSRRDTAIFAGVRAAAVLITSPTSNWASIADLSCFRRRLGGWTHIPEHADLVDGCQDILQIIGGFTGFDEPAGRAHSEDLHEGEPRRSGLQFERALQHLARLPDEADRIGSADRKSTRLNSSH